MGKTTERTGIKVLIKAMGILNLLGNAPETELSLSEIARRLDINRSTCHHILDTLAGEGYVEKAAPGQYMLGIKLFQVGSRVVKQLDVRERAQTAMTEAQRLTGETVFLYIPRGDEAVCVERLDGQYPATHLLRVGSALPFHVGASPKVFLAAKEDEEIERYFERAQAAPTIRHMLDTRRLWRDVSEFREKGCITSVGDVEVNTHAVGAPVYDHTDSVVGAVSISWVEALSTSSESEIRAGALRAARRTSEAMGHSNGEDIAKEPV